jgi:hypothetical protein
MSTCYRCGERPAVPDLIACGPCLDQHNRESEAYHRAEIDAAVAAATARMAELGSPNFRPESAAERRLQKAARRNINFGSVLL